MTCVRIAASELTKERDLLLIQVSAAVVDRQAIAAKLASVEAEIVSRGQQMVLWAQADDENSDEDSDADDFDADDFDAKRKTASKIVSLQQQSHRPPRSPPRLSMAEAIAAKKIETILEMAKIVSSITA